MSYKVVVSVFDEDDVEVEREQFRLEDSHRRNFGRPFVIPHPHVPAVEMHLYGYKFEPTIVIKGKEQSRG